MHYRFAKLCPLGIDLCNETFTNSFHAGGLFQCAGARLQGACTSARLARAHARTPAILRELGFISPPITLLKCFIFYYSTDNNGSKDLINHDSASHT